MIMCKFWNETGAILPFLLLLDCFCDAEKAARTRDEATAHPQHNHHNSTSIIPKFTHIWLANLSSPPHIGISGVSVEKSHFSL
jgi:hypothetical protein